MLNVRCDSYLGMDYEAPVQLEVHEAPKPIFKNHPQWQDISSDVSDENTSECSCSGTCGSNCTESSYDDDEESYELAE